MKGPGCSRDEAECMGAFGDTYRRRPMQPAVFGLDARTIDFDTGQTNLKPITGQAPALTAAQMAAAAAGRTAFNTNVVRASAAATSVANLPFMSTRTVLPAANRDLAAENAAYAKANSGGILGILNVVKAPVQAQVAAKLQAAGATPAQVALYNQAATAAKPTAADIGKGVVKSAIIMAPLVAAPVLAAAAPVLLPALAPIVKPAISLVRDFVTPDAVASVKSAVNSADRLITDAKAGVTSAQQTISDTQKAAAAGVADAKRGLSVLTSVDVARDAPLQKDGTQLRAIQDILASSSTGREPMPAPGAAFVRPAGTVATLAPKAIKASVWTSFDPATTGAPPSTDPKYLVLDSGQVLSGEFAKQAVPGFVVRFNGSVVRQ